MPRGAWPFQYEAAKVQGRLWTPAVLIGSSRVAAWYDAGDISTVSYATALSALRDRARFIDTTQSTAGNQLPWTLSGWTTKDRPAIAADGGAKWLVLASGMAYSGANGFSSMSAVEQISNSQYRDIYSGIAGAMELRFSNVNKVELVRCNQAIIATSTSAPAAGARLIGCDTATNISVIWVDGAADHNSAANGAYSQPVNLLCINGASATLGFNGAWGETVFSVFKWSDAERQSVEGYLAWKWGIVANLPATHPYRAMPPLIGA